MFELNYHTIIQSLAVLISSIAIIFTLFKKKKMTFNEVKGGLPILGQVFTMTKGSPWDVMDNWVQQYGLTYSFLLFNNNCLCVADPALLSVILQTKLSSFRKDVEFTYKPFMVLLGRGIVTSEGSEWTRQRAHLSAALRIDILTVIPIMAIKAVRRFCVKFDKYKLNNEPIDMAEEFRQLTLQVIAEAVLSISPEESDATFAHMYLPIVLEGTLRTWNPLRMYFPNYSWFKYQYDVFKLNDYVSTIIKKRWEIKCKEELDEKNNIKSNNNEVRKKDILDKIMQSYTLENWSDDAIEQIRDEIKTFILAGHETSASMLTWALYEIVLSQNNKDSKLNYYEKIRNDAKEVFKNYLSNDENILNSFPTSDDYNKLNFADSCLRESLRKYSNVPTVVRIAKTDVEFEGSEDTPKGIIPAGTTVMINMQGVHHCPKFWPEPLKYDPYRFMDGMDKITKYTFLPFIEGARMCLGQYLSLLESKIVLSLLCLKYKFEIVNDNAGEKDPFMIPIIPKHGHFMKIH